MAMGSCSDCERMVSISPRGMRLMSHKGNKYSDRQQEWYPVMHTTLEGEPCDGHKKAIL